MFDNDAGNDTENDDKDDSDNSNNCHNDNDMIGTYSMNVDNDSDNDDGNDDDNDNDNDNDGASLQRALGDPGSGRARRAVLGTPPVYTNK